MPSLERNILLSKCWSSCPRELSDIRHSISKICSQVGYSDTEINEIVLAIDEACTNIIRYAYNHCSDGEIRIEVFTDECELTFRLADNAEKVSKDCLEIKKSSPLKPGGLGVILMHKVMDSVAFVHTDSCTGNILEMKKYLPKEM